MYIQYKLEIVTCGLMEGKKGDTGDSFVSASQNLISFMRFKRQDAGTKALSYIV